MRRIFEIGGRERELWLSHDGTGYALHEGERQYSAALTATEGKGAYLLECGGRRIPLRLVVGDGAAFIHMNGRAWEVAVIDPAERLAGAGSGAGGDVVLAPMPGVVVSVAARPGDTVAEGQPILVIESMKLETTLIAPRAGRLAEIGFGPGESFGLKAVLARLAPEES